jgi:hypothetical protein
MNRFFLRCCVRLLAALCFVVPAVTWAQDSAPFFDPAAVTQDPAAASAAWIETGKRGSFAGAKKIIVPTFRVAFAVKARGSAHAGGGLGSRGTASIHGQYLLNGPDNAAMQAITDAVYDHFMASLKARGLEVIPYESLPQAARERLTKSGQSTPVEFKRAAGRNASKDYRLFTAKGLPFYTSLNDPVRAHLGMGAQLSNIGWDALDYVESELSGELQATVLRPTFWLDFIDMETDGGFFSQRASVSGEPGVKISAESDVRLMGPEGLEKKPRPTGGTIWATSDYTFTKMPIIGLKRTVQPQDSGLKGMEDTTSGAVAVVQTATMILGALSGIGGGRKDKTYSVNVDANKFQMAARSTMSAIAELWTYQIAAK